MRLDRRSFALGAVTLGVNQALVAVAILKKTVPSTGENVLALDMGSWLTFDVGDDVIARERRAEVLRAFLAAGGCMIDNSPKYGSS